MSLFYFYSEGGREVEVGPEMVWLIGGGSAHPYEEVSYGVFRLEDF